MAEEQIDRRKFTRVDFKTGVTLRQDEEVFHTTLVDISLNGMLVENPTHYVLDVESPIDASIILSDDAEIQMSALIAHSNDKHLGFKCRSIDMDSIAHLRRLIELNINDDSAADRVLSELIELHYH